MRKCIAVLLTLILLCGCAGAEDMPQSTAAPTTPLQSQLPLEAPSETGEIAFSDPGQCRIAYTGQIPWVRYITSRDQLPEQEMLKDYDEDFFRENALVVLCVTLNSGSIRPRIGQILYRDGRAEVIVIREAEGDVMTQDLAAWLLWARVDRDLSCPFRLEEDFLPDGAEKY